MDPRKVGRWLQRRAENVLAGLLGVMFFAFMVQIVFRYFFNFPTGWTTELTVVTWLWMVLWGAAFVVKESEEIRIDLVTSMVGRRARLAMAICRRPWRSSSCTRSRCRRPGAT